MNYSKCIGLSSDVINGDTYMRSVVASSVLGQVRDGGSPIKIYNVAGKKDPSYWRFHLRALSGALHGDLHEDITLADAMMSFISAFLNDPADGMAVIGKRHNYGVDHLRFKREYGAVMPTCAVTGDMHDSIENSPDSKAISVYSDVNSVFDTLDETCYNTVLTFIVLLATKAVTAETAAISTAKKRIQAIIKSYPMCSRWIPTDEAAQMMLDAIKGSIPLRTTIVHLVITADGARDGASGSLMCVSHAGSYLKMVGLTAFQMVCKHVISAKMPILAVSSCRAQVDHMVSLLSEYRDRGAMAPYLKFLGNPGASRFNPANFPTLYKVALGIASVHEESMEGYVAGGDAVSSWAYAMGKKYAEQSHAEVDPTMMKDLSIHQEDMMRMKNISRQLKRVAARGLPDDDESDLFSSSGGEEEDDS